MEGLTRREYWDSVHASEQAEARPRPSWRARLLGGRLGSRVREYAASYDEHLLWHVFYPRCLPGPGATVVEVGSAPGLHLARLHDDLGLTPYGIEYSESGVSLNRTVFAERGIDPCQVLALDFFSDECLAACQGRFDVVVSRGFIEHFEDAHAVVRRHLELLRPGGVLIVTIPNLRGLNHALCRLFHPETLAMHNLAIMQRTTFAALFDTARVRPVACTYFGTFSFYLFNVRPGSRLAPLLRLCMAVQPLLNVLFRVCFGERGAESRFASPQLLFAGIKV